MIGKDGSSVKTIEEYPRRKGKTTLIHVVFTKKEHRAVYK
jgi:hypothetical protein